MITLVLAAAFPDPDGAGKVALADVVPVEGNAYRHLFRARRLALGDSIRLVDGGGAARWAEVVDIDRSSARLRPGAPAPANEPVVPVGLLVAAPKPQRAGWLVEKATELGIDTIRFIHSARSPRAYGSATLKRLRRIATSAVEQCHRAKIPDISGVHEWQEIADLLEPWQERWLLDRTGNSRRPEPATRSSILVVGPEGGFSEPECLELSDLGCRLLRLGERVLRVETAATVGSALLLLATVT